MCVIDCYFNVTSLLRVNIEHILAICVLKLALHPLYICNVIIK